ncbi:cell wall degradation protein [Adhaeribacter aerolatus]|uniref:Cell wall degradation protein n=1 Tax=Adhaeribacter aerolatus TaxID=670289 RepID=A0A512B583_9BACT|nr:cell wall degradation protein [Adhaeribacter aerolatus]
MALLNEWATFPKDLCLRPNDTLDFILNLRKNLLLTGDLEKKVNSANNFFDPALTMAVKKFQRRHNLASDGIAGQQTIEALNITPAQRVQQIQLNIKRWQADSALMVQPHVLVNIPDYTLQLIGKAHHTIWQTRVIVGQTLKGFSTTIMAGNITYLVINPGWHIPQSIILREIIPILKADPAYLTRNHMTLYRLNGSRSIKTSAEAINWFTFNPINEPIRIVQEPGPWNALGNLKFIFPNENNIYLHDTPFKALFEQPVRTYSHGCIRVEHPHTLATYLLSTNWQNPVELTSIRQEKELNKIMPLPKPVPVKIGYYTCWVDAAGDLQFRKDIYKLDNLNQNFPLKTSLPGPEVKVPTETKV